MPQTTMIIIEMIKNCQYELCEYMCQNDAVMCRQVNVILQTQWQLIGTRLETILQATHL